MVREIDKVVMEERFVGERIDKVLLSLAKERLPAKYGDVLSRTMLQRMILPEVIKINDDNVKASHKVEANDDIQVDFGMIQILIEEEILRNEQIDTIEPEEGQLDIIDETEDYIIINKQSGVVVHPAAGNANGTIANWVKQYMMDKGAYDNRLERAGLVHRLDKDVSGLMVIAKNRECQLDLKHQFESHTVVKIYSAKVREWKSTRFTKRVEEVVTQDDTSYSEALEALKNDAEYLNNPYVSKVEGYITRDTTDRKKMRFFPLHAKVIKGKKRLALSYIYPVTNDTLLIRIFTGRMHQIRATLKYLGYSIEGDKKYGGRGGKEEMALQSILIGFRNIAGDYVEYQL